MCSRQNTESYNIVNDRINEKMNPYEPINEKTQSNILIPYNYEGY